MLTSGPARLSYSEQSGNIPHIKMEKLKDKNKEKTPAIDAFPTDETPTPTKILRMADMDPFFQDLKENPFDVHFRKATEAVKRGADILAASLPAGSAGER